MNTMHGFKILAASAVLILAGCLNGSQDENPNEKRIEFVKATSASVAEAANFADSELGAQCPKLAKLLDDLTTSMTSQSTEWPQSFQDFMDCFELPAQPTEQDFENFSNRMAEDPTKFLDCICGSTTLSDALKGRAFSADLSTAATTYFDASKSSGASSTFDASKSSGSGSKFDANKSSGASGGFGK